MTETANFLDLWMPARYAELTIEETEPQQAGPFVLRYRGTALIDHAISRNDVYYDSNFNNVALENTLKYMQGGEVVTVFSRHGKAVQFSSLPEGLPVGHVVEVFREGSRVKYEAGIVDTSEGADAAKLIRSGTIRASSIRMIPGDDFRAEKIVIEGRKLLRPLNGTIKGIDLADEAGIQGAGIEMILEEAPKIYIQGVSLDPGGEEMDWQDLTIDLIREHRPELLEEFKVSVLEATPDPALVEELQTKADSVEGLEAKIVELEERVEELVGVTEATELETAPLKLQNALLEASQIGASREIFKLLSEKVDSVEGIDGVLEEVRREALNTYIQSKQRPEIPPTGKADPVNDDSEPGTRKPLEETKLSEEQKRILELSGMSRKA